MRSNSSCFIRVTNFLDLYLILRFQYFPLLSGSNFWSWKVTSPLLRAERLLAKRRMPLNRGRRTRFPCEDLAYLPFAHWYLFFALAYYHGAGLLQWSLRPPGK